MDHYLWQIEEAKRRDHRKLGRELELVFFDEVAPGQPFWLPKGVRVLQDEDLVVATVREIAESTDEAAAAPAEGGTEPEVIGKKKEEGDEAAAAEEKK